MTAMPLLGVRRALRAQQVETATILATTEYPRHICNRAIDVPWIGPVDTSHKIVSPPHPAGFFGLSKGYVKGTCLGQVAAFHGVIRGNIFTEYSYCTDNLLIEY